jgi:hypothetical protein
MSAVGQRGTLGVQFAGLGEHQRGGHSNIYDPFSLISQHGMQQESAIIYIPQRSKQQESATIISKHSMQQESATFHISQHSAA